MKKAYNGWLPYFKESVNALSFNPYTEYEGEDKNLLAWRSKEDFISWYGQPPGSDTYRDDGFYVRELSWLSMWCKPKTVVEFGTDKGIGTFILSRLNPQAAICTIENRSKVLMPDDSRVEPGFLAKNNELNIIFYQKDSKDFSCYDAGICFIDGDHSREAVYNDSLRAWKNRRNYSRWVIVWHDYREGQVFMELKIAINRFANLVQKQVYKFKDSSTVWMTNET